MALLLTRKDVEAVLTMGEAMKMVEEAFRQFALGRVEMPLRTAIRVQEHHGLNLGMPAYIGGEMGALGLKVVSVYPDNPSQFGLPTVLATMLLNDPGSGALLAIMDGTYLTALRTGAASGVATKYLARPEAKVVGLFGAGTQARTQLLAVCEARKIELAKVFDLLPGRGEEYAGEMSQQLGVEVVAVDQPRLAVEGSDIVVMATSSQTPVLDGRWLAEGSHINAIGSHSPGARELDERTVARASVFVDSREAALAEAGDLIIPLKEGAITAEHIRGELGEVVAGQKEGRAHEREITLFKSVGLALQDVSTAQRVYQVAKERGIGQEVSL